MATPDRVAACWRCSWWDSLSVAQRKGPPACPGCGGHLMAFPNEEAFYKRVAARGVTREFAAWLRGRSLSGEAAVPAYHAYLEGVRDGRLLEAREAHRHLFECHGGDPDGEREGLLVARIALFNRVRQLEERLS